MSIIVQKFVKGKEGEEKRGRREGRKKGIEEGEEKEGKRDKQTNKNREQRSVSELCHS